MPVIMRRGRLDYAIPTRSSSAHIGCRMRQLLREAMCGPFSVRFPTPRELLRE
jgi:hypothetical protein